MSDLSVAKVLFALGRTAEQLFERATNHYGKESLSADELRSFVRIDIELGCSRSYNCRKFWQPLSDEQKQAALATAIPEGSYPQQWDI